MKTIIAAIALCLASAAWGDTAIYKWVDAQGVTHYSTVPHDSNAKPIGIVNASTLPNPSTAPFVASAAAPSRASNPEDADLLKPTPDDSDTCKSARKRLTAYLSVDQLYKVDDKGQKIVLTKAEQDDVIDLARSYVRQSCGAGGP